MFYPKRVEEGVQLILGKENDLGRPQRAEEGVQLPLLGGSRSAFSFQP